MTNNKNWPDRVYLRREKEGSSSVDLIDHTNRNGGSEYISAEKVREIQLSTIKATLGAAMVILAMSYEERCLLGSLDTQSIIEQVKTYK